MEIKKPYNDYQVASYRRVYSTDPKKVVKATHYVCRYGDRTLCNPTSYALCTENMKLYKRMGNEYPNKELLTIKPYKH